MKGVEKEKSVVVVARLLVLSVGIVAASSYQSTGALVWIWVVVGAIGAGSILYLLKHTSQDGANDSEETSPSKDDQVDVVILRESEPIVEPTYHRLLVAERKLEVAKRASTYYPQQWRLHSPVEKAPTLPFSRTELKRRRVSTPPVWAEELKVDIDPSETVH